MEHLGRRPTEAEAREIQFPILTHLSPETFGGHRYLKRISPEAAAKAERFQRYDAGENQVLLLSVLAELSNHDKHREIRPAFFIPANTTLSLNPAAELMIDCKIPSEIVDDREVFAAEVLWNDQRPSVGGVVAGLRVEPTGPSPDIDIEPEITGDIELGEGGLTFGTLDELGNFVSGTLNWFAPLLGDQAD